MVELGDGQEELTYRDLLGSAFLIGRRGFALTASHVFPRETGLFIAGLFVGSNETWCAHLLSDIERHATADVSIFRLPQVSHGSPLRLRNQWEGSSCNYKQFGYPADVLNDLIDHSRSRVTPRPDLIYVQGYVRRRVSFELSVPNVIGSKFFEVSELAGPGCSGGPLFVANNDVWDVIGIYAAEKKTETCDTVLTYAYATREDAFRDWKPKMLSGRTVLEESQDVTI